MAGRVDELLHHAGFLLRGEGTSIGNAEFHAEPGVVIASSWVTLEFPLGANSLAESRRVVIPCLRSTRSRGLWSPTTPSPIMAYKHMPSMTMASVTTVDTMLHADEWIRSFQVPERPS